MKENANVVKTGRRHFSVFTTSCNINNAFLNQSYKSEQGKSPQLKVASTPNKSKVYLKPNSIFAFQNDDIYASFCKENDNVTSDPNTLDNEPANINLSSKCFSNCENRSHKLIKIKKEATAKGDFEEDNCNISSDIEKNFDCLLDTEPTEFKNTYRAKVENQSDSIIDSKKGDVINEHCIEDKNQKDRYKNCSEGSNFVQGFSKFLIEEQRKNFKRGSVDADEMREKALPGTFEKILEKLTNLQNDNEMKNSPNSSIDCSDSNQSSASPNLSFSPAKHHSSNNPNLRRNTMANPQTNCPVLQINTVPLKRGSQNFVVNNFLTAQNYSSQLNNFNQLASHSPIQGSPKILNSFNRGAFLNMVNPINQSNFGAIKPGINYKSGCVNLQQCGPLMNKMLVNSSMMNTKGISLPINCMPSNNFCDDKYLFENLVLLLKDQNGCRLVQKRLEEKCMDHEFFCAFYEKIESILVDVINNQFGNYVVQKFFEIVQKDQILVTRFFEKIKNSLFSISINSYGTRFFQRALECLITNYPVVETPYLNDIFKDLVEKHLLDLIVDTNGNHVFQKIILAYPKSKNQFIFDELMKNAYDISKLKQGGCILQRAFDNANIQQKQMLVWKILSYLDSLINDEYGNFIIQQILFLKIQEFNEYILKFLKENFLQLSKKKFSSNVIDKCIILPDCGIHLPLIIHMIESRLVNELISDKYGNYVVQKALQISDGIHFMAIIHQIKPVLKTLKQTSHGRKIYESLIMQYGDYFQEEHLKYKNTNDGRRKSQQIGIGTLFK